MRQIYQNLTLPDELYSGTNLDITRLAVVISSVLIAFANLSISDLTILILLTRGAANKIPDWDIWE